MKSLLGTVLLLLSGSLSAAIIDFEDAARGSFSGYTSQGFDITPSGSSVASIAGNSLNANTGEPTGNLLNFCPYCNLTEGFILSAADGSLFNLESFDAGWFEGTAGELTVVGTYGDSSTISASFNELGIWLDTVNLDGSWSGLASVEFISQNTSGQDCQCGINTFGIDNIAATAVPIPAAAWLFVSALAGLGGWRRFVTSNS